jgi:hypothetical protein
MASKFTPSPFSDALASDLGTAWHDRLADARVLRDGGRHAASIAAGLYALEILLKERICQLLKVTHLPSAFQIHDLEGLATLAGLRSRLDDPAFKQSLEGKSWSEVIKCGQKLNDYRYQPNAATTKQEADDFFFWLLDLREGIIPWI